MQAGRQDLSRVLAATAQGRQAVAGMEPENQEDGMGIGMGIGSAAPQGPACQKCKHFLFLPRFVFFFNQGNRCCARSG